MSALNIRIIRQQVGVAPIDNARIVAKPATDLVQTDASRDEQTGKGAPESMRRNPRKPTRSNMVHEWPGEIIAVSVSAVFYFRPEHKRIAQAVVRQKTPKFLCQRDGAFLPVFEIHRGSLA